MLVNAWNGALSTCAVVDREVHATISCNERERVEWSARMREAHRQLRSQVGIISIGHSPPRPGAEGVVRRALVEASDALRLGERVFGEGHITSYGDARLAALLFRHVDIQELRWLHERTIGALVTEDQASGSELVATLQAYCDRGGSVSGTAAHMGIHRNTVLYRVRRIRELTMTDLDDGSNRLLLQVGLLAGRLVTRTDAPEVQSRRR